MTSEQSKKLFDDQINFSKSGTAGEKGTGFGMLLCDLYLKEFKAQIEVISKDKETFENDHGTTFHITFDMAA